MNNHLMRDLIMRPFSRILQCYGKTFLNVACLIGDNCSVNQSLTKKSKCYLVGCPSHRLNLGVQNFLRNYSDIIDSVRAVMIALRTIKLRVALRKKTNLSRFSIMWVIDQ